MKWKLFVITLGIVAGFAVVFALPEDKQSLKTYSYEAQYMDAGAEKWITFASAATYKDIKNTANNVIFKKESEAWRIIEITKLVEQHEINN